MAIKKMKLSASVLFVVWASTGTAQMQHDTTAMSGMSMMSHAFSRNLPMSRNGSGTGWLPDASSVYAYMFHARKWMFMAHGDLFVRYNMQDITGKGSRGGSKFDVPDMLMLMGQRQTGTKGLFHFNVMLSTDPLIAGGEGYPLLFQTGESWDGKPLVDRQHPHDVIAELSVSYAHSFSPKSDAYVYLAYPGEPALGPVTFMHRVSGRFNPDAPISHHWADATHITFGVATAGIRVGKFKIEGSSFTGREPDENRFNFDKPRFDSWSARLSCNPTRNWALQASGGFVKSPEELHPAEDIRRFTVSATYSRQIGSNTYFDATALWGMNVSDHAMKYNALLGEANLKTRKWVVYSRAEWVQKSAEELDIAPFYGTHEAYNTGMLTAGVAYDLATMGRTVIAPGLQMSVQKADVLLESLYGRYPVSGEVYVHIYPARLKTAM